MAEFEEGVIQTKGKTESKEYGEVCDEFKKDYKDAYFSIDKAIKLDEQGKLNEALPLYELGLNLIDKALSTPLTASSKPWEEIVTMQEKMKKTKEEISCRIKNINSEPQQELHELPSSYEDRVSSSKSDSNRIKNANGNTFELPGTSKAETPYIPPSVIEDQELLANLHFVKQQNDKAPITYSDLSLQLKEMKLAKNMEILFYCDNVQLFFISPDGRVSSTFENNKLIFARMHDEALEATEKTFLQVGSWVYPLIPEVSPFFLSKDGAFILPDINSGIEGATVGIIVPENLQEEVHELFDLLLNEPSAGGRTRRSVKTDEGFSSKFVQGASYLAQNLVRGAGKTSEFIDFSTQKIKGKINPNPQVKEINPNIQTTVEVAKMVSGKAVDVTDYLATKICMATSALGKYLYPFIHRQGTHLIASTINIQEKEAAEKMNAVFNVTSNAVEGISTVYSGLDTAGRILAGSLKNNSIQLIEHKYGHSAGALTSDALTTFGNIYYTRQNIRFVKPKGIAKAAVRGAGQAMLEDYRNSLTNLKPHEELQGSEPGSSCGYSKT